MPVRPIHVRKLNVVFISPVQSVVDIVYGESHGSGYLCLYHHSLPGSIHPHTANVRGLTAINPVQVSVKQNTAAEKHP